VGMRVRKVMMDHKVVVNFLHLECPKVWLISSEIYGPILETRRLSKMQ